MCASRAVDARKDETGLIAGKGAASWLAGHNQGLSPARIFALIIILTGIIELLIMSIMHFLGISPIMEAAADTLILTLAICPAIYYLIYLPMNRNIKAMEQAKERERYAADTLRAISEAAPDALIMMDPNGKVVLWSNASERIFGYSASEAIGFDAVDLIIPERHHQQLKDSLGVFAATGEGPMVGKMSEISMSRKGGQEFPAELSVSPVKHADMYSAIAILRDITERKKSEDDLRKSEKRYKTLLENIPQKIFYKNRDSVYISCNENYARDLKIRPEEIEGKTDYDFYPKNLAEKYRADDERIMRTGTAVEIDEDYIQDWKKRSVYTFKAPIRDNSGNVIGILGIFQDITDRKDLEKKAEERLDHLMRFQKIAVDREFRIKELIDENRRLKEVIREIEGGRSENHE